MRTGIFRLYIQATKDPYELTIQDNFSFSYGFGQE
jgi:hypothetical protein